MMNNLIAAIAVIFVAATSSVAQGDNPESGGTADRVVLCIDGIEVCNMDAVGLIASSRKLVRRTSEASEESGFTDTLIYEKYDGFDMTFISRSGGRRLISIIIDDFKGIRLLSAGGEVDLSTRVDTLVSNQPLMQERIGDRRIRKLQESINEGTTTGLSLDGCHVEPDYDCYGSPYASVNLMIQAGYTTQVAVNYECD